MIIGTRRNDDIWGNKRKGVNWKDIVWLTELLERLTGAKITAQYHARDETMSTLLLLQPKPPNTYYLPHDLRWNWVLDSASRNQILLRFSAPLASYHRELHIQSPCGYTWPIEPRPYAWAQAAEKAEIPTLWHLGFHFTPRLLRKDVPNIGIRGGEQHNTPGKSTTDRNFKNQTIIIKTKTQQNKTRIKAECLKIF